MPALDAIRNGAGERLDFALHEGGAGRREILVIGHGVTANKDREWAVALATRAAAAGLDALRFSFSGNGDSEGAFEDSCPTKEAADLGCVLDVLGQRPVAYAGHSMGGAVGVLRASDDPRIRWLVSLAGMVDTGAFADRKFGELTPGRDCMWEKPECPLSQAFLDDMHTIGSVEPLAASISAPWLLVHGTADAVVPFEESQRIARAVATAELIPLDGVDHVFTDAADTMAGVVGDWLERELPAA